MRHRTIFAHYPNQRLNLLEQVQYGKVELDSEALPFVQEYLNATKELIGQAVHYHSRLLAVRLQIDFPKKWKLETCLNPDRTYHVLFSIYNYINKHFPQNPNQRQWRQKLKLYYVCSVEYDHMKKPVINLLLMLDGWMFRGLGPSSAYSYPLKKMIEFAVCGGVKLPLKVVRNECLINYLSIHHIDKHATDAKTQMHSLMKHGSYLCQANNKIFGFDVSPFRAGVFEP